MLSPKYGLWLASTGVSPLTLSTKRLPDCVTTGCKLPPVWSSARKRRQVGHTNRFQLHGFTEVVAVSDLLGQAQVDRSMRTGMNATLKSIRTADFQVRGHDDAPCYESTLPQITSPQSSAVPTHSRPCSLSPGSPSAFKPEEKFYMVSRQTVNYSQPDAVLECLGSQWELHLPYLIKSSMLTNLYATCRKQRLPYPPPEPAGPHSRPESQPSQRKRNERKALGPLFMQLHVKDPSITKEALSFALRTLYAPDTCPEQWTEGLLAAAICLGLPPLFERCLSEMQSRIRPSTVCEFHSVASRYKEESLVKECEKWLERHLVCELSNSIYLKYLPLGLLLKTLQSPRVFTPSEYQMFRTVLYWVYLQFNIALQVLPTHSHIITFFSSWPREGAFLEQPEGLRFSVLFHSLRLHGITDCHHLEEMQRTRIFPQSWLLHLFSSHYYTILKGGDMPVSNFSQQAVRFGMVIDGESQCCSQTVGLWGLYFIMSVAKTESNTHIFSMQRLKPWDSELPSCAWQRHPVSMMAERLVRYQVLVQSQNGDQWKDFCSGPIHHEFGLNKPSCHSEVFKLSGLTLPILVTFALALPPL
ncbi:BTB/POZ domain-containing protein 16 isoform X2 [Alosa sapidissima]|uniref:BTB/POZ domain-containing protein 16 isoform X2 n=1 Tax=Alosa sapidissima TaxID=34773 RepID=UPI001C09FC0B|nr:BTB/POZ domain-containing protein 16 isoform X2 [Alosa sapidissima]